MSGVATSLLVVAAIVLVVVGTVRSVPPRRAYVVELLGRYRRTLDPGVHFVLPLLESVRSKVDLGEQVATFPPQPAITLDNRCACVRTVLYYSVADPVRVTYEIFDSARAMEQLTITVLRNLMGGMEWERAQTSRDELNVRLRQELNESAQAWGIAVHRTEITAIDTGSEHGCT
jgi:regulator of protease activity HflC (stomatin/prohibitin superfamily)